MIHTSLMDYYSQLDAMVSLHNYSKEEVENSYPYERDIFIDLIIQRQQNNGTQ